MAHTFTSTSAASPMLGTPGAAPLNHKPKPPFFLMHHPLSWECIKTANGWEWLPRLKPVKAEAGQNGVRQTRGGADIRPALTRFRSEGWVILDRPAEVMEGGYVRATQGVGGLVHHLFCDSFKQVGQRVIEKTDDAAWNAFRRQLVEDGWIPAPEPEVLEAIIERQAHRLGRTANNAHIPAVKARRDADAERIDGMKAAAKAITEGEPSTPAPKRRRNRRDG